jgi:hypothetical protein
VTNIAGQACVSVQKATPALVKLHVAILHSREDSTVTPAQRVRKQPRNRIALGSVEA